MSKPSTPATVRLRYVGVLPVSVYFLETGRTVDMEADGLYDLLPAEAAGLAEHPDYTPEEGNE